MFESQILIETFVFHRDRCCVVEVNVVCVKLVNIDSISAAVSLSESCSVFFCFCSWVSSQVMAVVGGCECSDASVFIYISTVVLFHHGASGHLPPSITSVFPEELRHRTTLIITKTPESLRGTGLSFSRSLAFFKSLIFP